MMVAETENRGYFNLCTGLNDDNDLVQMAKKRWRKMIICLSYLNFKDRVACVFSCVNVPVLNEVFYVCVCVCVCGGEGGGDRQFEANF